MDKIFYFLTSISALTSVAIWLGKLVINKTFDLGLEKYKASLQKENEVHKSLLSRQSLEHQVKFSKLHEDRAEKIKILFSMVIDLEQALIFATTVAQGPDYLTDDKRDNDCINKLRTLIGQLDLDRIYFTSDTISKFDSIIKESWDIIFKMKQVREIGKSSQYYSSAGQKIPEMYYSNSDKWQEAYSRTQNEFKSLKESLANDFRTLLGI